MTLTARLLAVIFAIATASYGQCMKANADCTEKVPLGPEGRFSVVYRSFGLLEPNADVQRALIVLHGSGRNADGYFTSAMAGAVVGQALENTIVVSPRFASSSGTGCTDKLEAGEISWTCGGPQDWRRGGTGVGLTVTTFDLIDAIIVRLAEKKVFPNLKTIVVSGHSAGGQFVHRYAAVNKIDGIAGVTIRYVVSNPSSYLYLDNLRLVSGECDREGKCTGEFQPYQAAKCADFNSWHYGMNDRAGYSTAVPDEEIKKNLTSRDVYYLLGDLDTLPIGGFDSSCAAIAQGPSRLARGLNHWNHMRARYGAQHKLVIVPYCGHNGRCMYTADAAMPVIFP